MKTIIRDILLPIDMTDASLNALNTAINMAFRHRANLHLLYLKDSSGFYPRTGRLAEIQTMTEEVFLRNAWLFEQVAATVVEERRVNCRFHTAIGYSANTISDWATDQKIDLIVMGMPAKISAASYFYDSIAYKVVSSAPCHVMTIPENAKLDSFKHIVYPVQSQGVPMAKFPITRAIMEKNDSDVSVVKVLQPEDVKVLDTMNHLSERVQAKSRRETNKVRIRPLFTNNVARALNQLSRDEFADLVIIEANTRRNLKEYLFGNFTQKMIRSPNAAVLCVKTESITESRPKFPIKQVGKLQWN